MTAVTQNSGRQQALAWIFRIVLFASAASLAAYIPYKYATQLHAISGIYAFLFPLSSILAIAGIALAMRPQLSCDCNAGIRSGVGALSIMWMATGFLCVSGMTSALLSNTVDGTIAFIHMGAQHIVLSLSLLAFAFMPARMMSMLGLPVSESDNVVSSTAT